MDQRQAKQEARRMVAAFLDAATSCESDLTEGLSDYGLSDRQRIERAISEIIEHLRRRP